VLENGTVTPVGSTREKAVDVRVVAATNTDLQMAVDDKHFRSDLFYRLNVVRIDMPPLRDRLEDIPLLVRNLLGRLCREHKLAVPDVEDKALEALQRYRWPGNVRELRNTLESILILGQKPLITEADLPEHIRRASSVLDAAGGGATNGAPPLIDLDAAEKTTIEKALRQAGGDRTRAAQMLNVSVRTLYRKMARYGLR
jgi:DNA-binding NtrC family response regulator